MRIRERLESVECGLTDCIQSVEEGFDDVTSEVRQLKGRVMANEKNLEAKIDQALERKIKADRPTSSTVRRLLDKTRLTTKDQRRKRDFPSIGGLV